MAVLVVKDTARLILDESVAAGYEGNDSAGKLAGKLTLAGIAGRSDGLLDVGNGDCRNHGAGGVADIQVLDFTGLEFDAPGKGKLLLKDTGTGRDLEVKLVSGSGGERLDAHVNRGGCPDGQVGRVRHRNGSGRGGLAGIRSQRKGLFLKADKEITDNILRSREFDLGNPDRAAGIVRNGNGSDGSDVLHRDGRRLAGRNVRGDSVQREAGGRSTAGQMRHAVVFVLDLGPVGTAADVGTAVAGVDRRLKVGVERIQDIPVIGLSFLQVAAHQRALENAVLHIGDGVRVRFVILLNKRRVVLVVRRAGFGMEKGNLVIFRPLGMHSVIDGTRLGFGKDNLEGSRIETFEIDLLVTTGEQEGGNGQTRKEKGFFHHLIL